ncbi:MAG: sugar phosphate isomerase/epimerase [Saprospiraceae bacterium]
MKGPAIFLAQFIRDEAPFNSLDGICAWAAGHGYKGIQMPTLDPRLIDLKKAAESKTYCDELSGKIKSHGLEISELSTHLQGQLVAVHPAYDVLFDNFAPSEVKGKPKARTVWAIDQLKLAARASANLGLKAHVTFSGALAWPYVYPWPQRPNGLIEEAFTELSNRWMPILQTFEKHDVDLCFELHPGEDLHDGASFDRFLDQCDEHPRLCLNYDPSHFVIQQMDYLQFIDLYEDRIRMFHVKDAEFNPDGTNGVYGGYQDWIDRAGRFRSPGDGEIDFGAIFSKLTQYEYEGWAVLEWECCIKDSEQGAAEGSVFIKNHMINVTQRAFDDFAGGASDQKSNRKILGLDL